MRIAKFMFWFRSIYDERIVYAGDENHPVRLIMQMVVSIIILGAGCYALGISRAESDAAREVWAGLVGSVVTFWLTPNSE